MTERIDILRSWQELALVERQALVALRDQIADADENYPRLRALDGAIKDVDASITQRDASIENFVRADEPQPSHSRLQSLLRKQELAREERDAFAAARAAIQHAADDAGQADLTEEQDQRFRALTREIATVDVEISTRAQEIEVLAALAAY